MFPLSSSGSCWPSSTGISPAGPPAWVHGDLHPANILVNAGQISAVIDFGDLTSGDPANDLSVAWMMLAAKERAIFWQAYGHADDHTRARARGVGALAGAGLPDVLGRQSADGPDRKAHLPRGAEIGPSVAGYGGVRIPAQRRG
jgi:serine/threonine protein kinase